MRDYFRVLSKIQATPWLITPEGLEVILSIVNERLATGKPSDEEISQRLLSSAANDDGTRQLTRNGNIGVLPIHGPIFGKSNMMTELSGATSLEMFTNDLNTMLQDDSIASILLDIDSPGGTADLISETGDAIYAAKDVKPIYAIANTHMCSAAYWLGSQAEKVYATSTGSVGSIGVYTVHEDRSGADQQQGRKFTYVSAGPYKTEGNPHEPLSQDTKNFLQKVVNETYEEFINVVARGRSTDAATVESNFGGGRVLTAKMAQEAGMIDGITTFDKLVGQMISEQAPSYQLVSPDGQKYGVYFDGIDFHMDSTAIGAIRLESKEYEHSEPSTGSPPAPRTDQDGSDDKAITQGWRIEQSEKEPGSPGAPSPNANSEGSMNDEALVRLRAALNLDENATEDDVVNAVEAQASANAHTVGVSTEEARLKKEYPNFYAEHVARLERERGYNAKAFVDNIKFVKKQDGDKTILTKMGLSGLALDVLISTHEKFAVGHGTLQDFEQAINSVMVNGIVQYGEIGSNIPNEDVVINTDTLKGISDARKQFAAKVLEVQKAESLTYAQAVARASELHPDLAQAWKTTQAGAQ